MNNQSHQSHSIPGPEDISRAVLPNGIIVLCRSNFNSASVVVSGYINAGSEFDPLDKLGLAHFTSRCLMRGTSTSSFQELYDRLESAGASFGHGASVHTTSFSGRSLAEDLPLLFSTMAESLLEPVFPQDQFKRLKSQLVTSLAIRAESTQDMAAIEFDALLFPGHPYGRPEDGFTETIEAISRQDLVDFHHAYYNPAGMTIAVVGAVQPQDVLALVEKHFGGWVKPSPAEKPQHAEIRPVSEGMVKRVKLAGKSQSDLVMGCLGPARNAPEYLAASLGNSILGQFGLMGRIGDSVREKAGLAYYASTSLNAWREGGSWEVSAGVNPVNVDRAVKLITGELKRFTSELVTQEELEDNQNNYIGRMPLSLESNGGVANSILNLERFELGLDYPQRYPALIRAITREQILEAAMLHIDPQNLVIVSAGPDGEAG